MGVKVTNNAWSNLAAIVSNVATSLTVTPGQGVRFPVLGAGDYFYGTLVDALNNVEVVKVTARVGDVFTVVRAQDGTTANSYAISDKFELRPTAALFNEKLDALIAAATYAPINAPVFTGIVTIPAGGLVVGYSLLNSPAFTGVPTVPTAAPGTNTPQAASTEFVISTAMAAALPAQVSGQYVQSINGVASFQNAFRKYETERVIRRTRQTNF